ncbi:hypothetical protein Rs2_14992 [Raphanus sativus]|nr:hypothetical protein Rs2_14992 [Raphanus sativus]
MKRVFDKLHRSSSKTIKEDNDMIICTRRKTSERMFRSFEVNVHPVLCAPARDDKEKDDSRSCTNRCNLKDPEGFLFQAPSRRRTGKEKNGSRLTQSIPARTRVVEFGNMTTSGIAILVHAVIYFCILTILVVAIQVHIHF